MENKGDTKRELRTEIFVTSWGQEVSMSYNPNLDNLPKQTPISDKYSEANRRRLNLKPPIDLGKLLGLQAD